MYLDSWCELCWIFSCVFFDASGNTWRLGGEFGGNTFSPLQLCWGLVDFESVCGDGLLFGNYALCRLAHSLHLALECADMPFFRANGPIQFARAILSWATKHLAKTKGSRLGMLSLFSDLRRLFYSPRGGSTPPRCFFEPWEATGGFLEADHEDCRPTNAFCCLRRNPKWRKLMKIVLFLRRPGWR